MATARPLAAAVAALLAALLAACALRLTAPPSPEAPAPAGPPQARYLDLQARGRPVYRVASDRSLVVVTVRRDGWLARLGHDHVIASRDVSGYVAPDEGRADLEVPLDTLVVDDPALRAQAGLDTTPTAEDVAGTRRNMLERVLETGLHPDARIAIAGSPPGGGDALLAAEVTLHGTTVTIPATARIERGPDAIDATGALELDQSRFGIAPFAILGGAVAVRDRVTVTFRIHAQRIR